MTLAISYYFLSLILYFLNQINDSGAQERMIRSSIRSMLENQLSPDFYPTRGRRSKTTSEEEEGEPPFWAQRGRSLDLLAANWPRNLGYSSSNFLEDSPFLGHPSTEIDDSEALPAFWASRGRSPNSANCIDPKLPLAYAEEPRVVVIERRDNTDDDRSNSNNFWASRGRRDHFRLKNKLNNGLWKRNTIKAASEDDQQHQKYADTLSKINKMHMEETEH